MIWRSFRETDDDRVVLTFDRETLQKAMEIDVAAHGFREKVLVLAVAATAASGAAASAAAEPGPFLGTGGPTVQQTLGADDRAVTKATPAPEPTLGADDRAVPRATPAPEPTLGADDRAVTRATPRTRAHARRRRPGNAERDERLRDVRARHRR